MPPRRVQPRVADAMTPGEFITKWRASQLKESAASQEHFIDLCRLLGEPTPAEGLRGGCCTGRMLSASEA